MDANVGNGSLFDHVILVEPTHQALEAQKMCKLELDAICSRLLHHRQRARS
jgi:hypothetical protein